MQCPVCKGSGKVQEPGIEPDDVETLTCHVCGGKGERNIILTITLWDEDSEKEITSRTVSLSLLEGVEAVRDIVNHAPELLKEN